MLLGDSGVGKTCFLIQFKDGAFLSGTFLATVGIDFRVRVPPLLFCPLASFLRSSDLSFFKPWALLSSVSPVTFCISTATVALFGSSCFHLCALDASTTTYLSTSFLSWCFLSLYLFYLNLRSAFHCSCLSLKRTFNLFFIYWIFCPCLTLDSGTKQCPIFGASGMNGAWRAR